VAEVQLLDGDVRMIRKASEKEGAEPKQEHQGINSSTVCLSLFVRRGLVS
jgi:hypothetical protein